MKNWFWPLWSRRCLKEKKSGQHDCISSLLIYSYCAGKSWRLAAHWLAGKGLGLMHHEYQSLRLKSGILSDGKPPGTILLPLLCMLLQAWEMTLLFNLPEESLIFRLADGARHSMDPRNAYFLSKGKHLILFTENSTCLGFFFFF